MPHQGARPGGWWVLLNRVWIMAAAANFLWSALPQLLLLLHHDAPREGGGGGEESNVSSAVPLSSLIHRPFPEEQRLLMREEARRMFYWGYDHYMQYAFPQDELNPIDCLGRGHDWNDLTNTHVNDALGDYCLTLVDSLDTLVIMGNASEFHKAVHLVVDNVSFNHCTTVQVFEATIRVLGSLLSAYFLTQNPESHFASLLYSEAEDSTASHRLLELAHDLAQRLLPSFEGTATGIPHPRVNLCTGVPTGGSIETCTAGAGTLTVEFTLLSRLLGDPTYERLARNAVRELWSRRHPRTGLVGNVINIQTGQWTGRMSGLGAGIDSFYEYLLKSYILFGEREDLEMFSEMYSSVMKYLRRGRSCREMFQESKLPPSSPFFVNVDYSTGKAINYWMDALSASFAGVQVLAGDLEEAICTHAIYYSIWRRYGALPERFDWKTKTPNVRFYPLRPELVESTYLLYQATQNPFYLHVGSDILNSLEKYTKTRCGYATLHDVITKTKEDRMESFFLSETCKYLYLLFDKDNLVNRLGSRFIFTTEGHVIQLDPALRRKSQQRDRDSSFIDHSHSQQALARINESFISRSCPLYDHNKRYSLPLSRELFGEIEALVGLYGPPTRPNGS